MSPVSRPQSGQVCPGYELPGIRDGTWTISVTLLPGMNFRGTVEQAPGTSSRESSEGTAIKDR